MVSEFYKRFIRVLLLPTLITCCMLSQPAFAEEVLNIGGTGCALGSMELIAKAFSKSNPGAKVRVITQSLGSSGGIKAVLKNAIDIGLSARPIADEEKKMGLWAIQYAKTPFIFVAKKDVTISDLSTGELAKILRSETETWPDGQRIRLVLRPSIESDTLLVKAMSPEMSSAMDMALSRKGMLVAMTDQECLDLIEKTAGGFGFATLTQVLSEKRPVNILPFNGLNPNLKSLADGSYPLSKSLFLVTKTKHSTLVRKFIALVQSSRGRNILEESGNLVAIGRSGQ